MEIPDKVLNEILNSMARSHLEDDDVMVEEELPVKKKPEEKKLPTRRFKSNPTILGTTTVLYSRDGKHRAVVQYVFNDIDDGFFYRVDVTGRTFIHHKLAINHARKWLRKKRMKYYKAHPKERPRIKTVRLKPKPTKSKIKTIQKLYKMERETAKILFRMSEKKLKVHENYARKKFNSEKTTAVSGDTKDFNIAVVNVMKDGTKKERKLVAKMLKSFVHEPFRKTNMFY